MECSGPTGLETTSGSSRMSDVASFCHSDSDTTQSQQRLFDIFKGQRAYKGILRIKRAHEEST